MTPERFIQKWQDASGSERANYQSFFNDLCDMLGVAKPDPAQTDNRDNAYVFERHIKANDGLSTGDNRFLDTYKRGNFIAEGKAFYQAAVNGKQTDSRKLETARAQAEAYARNLPEHEPWSPLLMVINVGRFIALYAQFDDKSRAYEMFPDRHSYRISIADLADPAIRERLRLAWENPQALNPAHVGIQVTQAVARDVGKLAQDLRKAGNTPEAIAGFLTRCLFCMFAEDVGLLPAHAFTRLLDEAIADPDPQPPSFVGTLGELWRQMDQGGYSVALRQVIPHFNGKLFKRPDVIALNRKQIETLRQAAGQQWQHVEPAIFGTLMERSLEADERHTLGAEYTPRDYVERLVLPTLIEPLRREWEQVRAQAWQASDRGQHLKAPKLLQKFHKRLCDLRVLDPACGSGNFLYIALEHLKRIEAEVMEALASMGQTQSLETEQLTVDPHQFLGIELNPRAAAMAELVLWIGHLQWHYRSNGNTLPATPILRDFKNIECRDAVLQYRCTETVLNAHGQPVLVWDGKTKKIHPATGKEVPDETATVPRLRYLDPKPATWPRSDVIVGNPPFIGAATMRAALGDGYVEALRAAWPQVPESADLVMYWWARAAELVAEGKVQRMGLITTNSLSQTFNRRVVQAALDAGSHLAFAIPDHPWVDSSDGAAVRIAMTLLEPGKGEGRLQTVTGETTGQDGTVAVTLVERHGLIHADLTVGANVAAAQALQANANLSNRGVQLFGAGFIVTPEEADTLLAATPSEARPRIIRDYRNGKDLTDKPRGVRIIDAFGLSADELRDQYPAVYQWLLERVKPERDLNNRESRRKNWWLFGETNPKLRRQLAGLPRYIATVETAKHRVFQFLDASVLPDNKLVAIALDDAFSLGVLTSRVHIIWALAAGSTLEDRPVYSKSTCFDTFPFPSEDTGLTSEIAQRIAQLAEQIDAHRKRQQAAHAGVSLTGMYNVLEALRAGRTLTPKEKALNEQALVGVLRSLHDELDAAVLQAYGWGSLRLPADVDIVLQKLVDLNARRAAEEAQGLVRWLRPAFQNPGAGAVSDQAVDEVTQLEPAAADTHQDNSATSAAPAKVAISPWPKTMPEKIKAVQALLTEQPQSAETLAASFSRRPVKAVREVLDTLLTLGLARCADEAYSSCDRSEG
jgi:hypothetical protein